MSIRYYFSVFPMEALVASELSPEQFGSYMATGARKGSAEKIIFIEVEGNFGKEFDWNYAEKNCIKHKNGDPKNSLYLSVYRVLERIPVERLKNVYLTTRDGRTIELKQTEYVPDEKKFWIYQELCPITPLVVSYLNPKDFVGYITKPENKIYVPRIIFSDLKVIDFDNPEDTGNIGRIYDRKIEHIKECIKAVTLRKTKINKTLDRSHVETFSFQIINKGIYIGDGKKFLMYKMPSAEEIKKIDYDWGRSAQIL